MVPKCDNARLRGHPDGMDRSALDREYCMLLILEFFSVCTTKRKKILGSDLG
jgi:hypothetical protein